MTVVTGAMDPQPNWWSGRRRSLVNYLKRRRRSAEELDEEEKEKGEGEGKGKVGVWFGSVLLFEFCIVFSAL